MGALGCEDALWITPEIARGRRTPRMRHAAVSLSGKLRLYLLHERLHGRQRALV